MGRYPAAVHQQYAVNLLSASSLIDTFGTLGIALILFAETGLLIGLFLPGDTLLFTAGVLAATAADSAVHLNLGLVLVAVALGSVIGSQVGYELGRKAGPRFITDARPRLTEARNKTAHFIERYGMRKAIALSRFVPIVRTVMSPLLGSLEVSRREFTIVQVVSGLVWSIGVTLAGWGVGSHIDNIDRYLLPGVAVIFAISMVPIGLELRKARRKSAGFDA
jgi:membrane-associated protein